MNDPSALPEEAVASDPPRTLPLPLILIPLIGIASMPFAAGDLAAWTALGLKMIQTGTLGVHDGFSVLPTSDFMPAAWGASLLYGALYKILLATLRDPTASFAILAALHWGFAIWILRWIFHRSRALVLPPHGLQPRLEVRLALYASWLYFIPMLGVRPAVLGLVPLVACIDLIQTARRQLSWKNFLRLVLVQVAWANLHGSFVLGPILLGWRLLVTHLRYLKHSKIKKIPNWKPFFQLGVVTLSSAIHPFGFKVFSYVKLNSEFAIKRRITEWATTLPWTEFPAGAGYYLLIALLAWVLLSNPTTPRQRWKVAGTSLLPLTVFGFAAIRNTGLVSLVALPILSLHFRNRFAPRGISAQNSLKSPIALAFTAVLAALWIALWPPVRPWIAGFLPESRKPIFLPAEYPPRLLQRIRTTKPNCPVFAEFELGGALMLSTQNRIFLDTRNYIYSDSDFLKTRSALEGEPGWKEWIESFGACWMMIEPKRHLGLWHALTESAENASKSSWRLMATEGEVALLFRYGDSSTSETSEWGSKASSPSDARTVLPTSK